ncbi:MAG TPA: nuclear transport factor 2 family protein [Puia sp.]|nr:nuclear transport factor 2 family protein [Puia sp.]
MPVKPEQQLFKDLTIEWMEAWKCRDKKKLNHILAADFVYITRLVKGMWVGKKEWLRLTMELYEVESYELEFICLNIQEHLAIIVYKQVMKAIPDHTGDATLHLVTDVWTKDGERWRAISRQTVQI